MMKQIIGNIKGENKNWEGYGKRKLYITLKGDDIRSRFNQLCWDLDSQEFTSCKSNLLNDHSMANSRWEEIKAAVKVAFAQEMGIQSEQEQEQEAESLKAFAETRRNLKGFYIRIRKDLLEDPLPFNKIIEVKGLSADYDGNGWGKCFPRNINEINRKFRVTACSCKILDTIYMPADKKQNPYLLRDWEGHEFGIVFY